MSDVYWGAGREYRYSGARRGIGGKGLLGYRVLWAIRGIRDVMGLAVNVVGIGGLLGC